MRLLICVDDTDNLESRGTGSIAAEMTGIIEDNKWGKCGFISRHQLILHKDVKYTSHNSSMCFNADIDEMHLSAMKTELSNYLKSESAEGADPGLCIAEIEKLDDNYNVDIRHALIEFGYRAKTEVLNKVQAYALAEAAGLFLRELGGTGDGIIGALAGIGLRLNGNDGEVKGGINHLGKGMSFFVSKLLDEKLISRVCTTEMKPLASNEQVYISWKAKPVLHEGQAVLLVIPADEVTLGSIRWQTMQKSEMRAFGDDRAVKKACARFKPDVPEEIVDVEMRSCFNCVFRRWTEKSFECMLD